MHVAYGLLLFHSFTKRQGKVNTLTLRRVAPARLFSAITIEYQSGKTGQHHEISSGNIPKRSRRNDGAIKGHPQTGETHQFSKEEDHGSR
jgi:hypothetical protein